MRKNVDSQSALLATSVMVIKKKRLRPANLSAQKNANFCKISSIPKVTTRRCTNSSANITQRQHQLQVEEQEEEN